MFPNPNGNNRVAGGAASPAGSQQIKANVHRRLLETMDLTEARQMPVDQLRAECSRRLDMLLNEQRCPLSAPEKQQLLREVMDEIFGLGPVEEFLRDPTVSDVLVNGSQQIYIERQGRLEKTTAAFRDDAQLIAVIQRIAASVGRRIDESSPMLDARLADGSRVNAIIPPLALDGPAMSIRRFGTVPITVAKLTELEALTDEMALFLEACVRCKINVLISGGTGSGKTTLLNVLSRWIPEGERVVTIEDAAELQLQREHVVRLETRPPSIEGKGEVTQRDLLRNTLRMRPDRIVIGEVRGAETLDMLQAMNTGHEGSMTTVHANTPRDALRRIENMVSMAGMNFPVTAIRQQTAAALELLVQLGRLPGGKRKVLAVTEVTGMEGEAVCMQELFAFRQMGVDASGSTRGQFEACGVRPQILDKLRERGSELPENLFHRRVLGKRTMMTGVPPRNGDRHG
ncbi:MAG TPA: CpaF family protein [Tepidisphaeraceae bacterium]|nr:CpaF family protein [Tepidisphaeraceae bacterium]